MLNLKKYLCLEEGEIFMIARYADVEFRVYENILEQRSVHARSGANWDLASDSTLLRLIMNAPESVVRTHRSLSSLERKQLQALLDLNLQYLAKDSDGFTCAYISKPNKDSREWFPAQEDDSTTDVFPIPSSCAISDLCRWIDDEPLNIATTLEAEYVRIQRH